MSVLYWDFVGSRIHVQSAREPRPLSHMTAEQSWVGHARLEKADRRTTGKSRRTAGKSRRTTGKSRRTAGKSRRTKIISISTARNTRSKARNSVLVSRSGRETTTSQLKLEIYTNSKVRNNAFAREFRMYFGHNTVRGLTEKKRISL